MTTVIPLRKAQRYNLHLMDSAVNAEDARADEALYIRYHEARDEEALAALIRRHFPHVFRLAWRIVRDPTLAEDAAQETFVALARRRAWRGEGTLASFIMRTAVNQARMASRARRRRVGHEAAAGGRRPPKGPDRESDAAAAVDEHVLRLPEDLRIPIVLRYSEGLGHEEVAAALGIPSGTASSRLRRGLEKLRESLVQAGFAAAVQSLEGYLSRLPEGPAAPPPPAAAHVSARAAALRIGTLKLLAGGAGVLATIAVVAGITLPPRLSGRPPAPVPVPGALVAAGAPVDRHAIPAPAPAPTPSPAPAAGAGTTSPDAPRPSAPSREGPADSPNGVAAAPSRGAAAVPDGPTTAALVEGRVVSGTDGGPIAGVNVRLAIFFETGTSWYSGAESTTTDPEGRFRVAATDYHKRLADGSISVGEDVANRAVILLHHEAYEPVSRSLSMDEARAHVPIVLRMAPGGLAFEGRVIDRATRVPVAGVDIAVSQHGEAGDPTLPLVHPRFIWSFMTARATSGPAGQVHIGGFRAGPVEVTLEDDRYGHGTFAFTLAPASPEPCVIEAEAGARVVVEAVDAAGTPVAEAQVGYVQDRCVNGLGALHGGRFVIAGLAAGAYRVLLSHGSVGIKVGGSGEVEPSDGVMSEELTLAIGEEKTVKLVLPEKGRSATPAGQKAEDRRRAPEGSRRIAGTILDPDGRPVADALVRMTGARIPAGGLKLGWPIDIPKELKVERAPVTTGADGHFSFEGLPDRGAFALEVAAAEFVAKRAALLPPDLDLASIPAPQGTFDDVDVIPLSLPTGSLALRLLRPATFSICVRPPDGISAERMAAALGAELSEPGGNWQCPSPRIEPTPEGTVRVTFEGRRPGPRRVLALRLPGAGGLVIDDLAAGAPERTVALERGASVRVRVAGFDHRPIVGPKLRLATVRGEPLDLWTRSATIDDDGRFVMTDLPRARLSLGLVDAGRELRTIELDASAGGDLGEIVLGPLDPAR